MRSEKDAKDTALQTDGQQSRRSLLKKTAFGVPIAMTLAHKPVFGAVCTLSGFQSVNPSGVARHTTHCDGFSPGGWRQNGYKTGNQDGNRNQWLAAGYYPNPREGHDDPASPTYDGAGTLFFAANAFQGATPTVPVEPSDTLHDVMEKYDGSLEFHAVANLLNAHYFNWNTGNGHISAVDVVGIYLAFTSGDATYTSEGGNVINLTGFDLKFFFAQLYH